MKGKWYINWLVVITLCLLFSSFGIFVFSLKNNISLTRCIYGDSLEENCICSADGEVICEDELDIAVQESKVVSNEFVSTNLDFKYDFLNFIDSSTFNQANVKFNDISHLNGGLKVTVERVSMCSEQRNVVSQLGFYKLEDEKLILTTTSNLTDSSYYISCITSNSFYIDDFNSQYQDNFQILYQDDLDVMYRANNCVYEGYLRNSGDVYKSKDNCSLCKCVSGENICEKEDSCLE